MNFVRVALCALLGVIVMIASACAQGEQAFSASERAQALEQLRGAQQTDYNKASDTKIGPVDRADYFVQAKKAELVSKELEHGFSVPRENIEDALAVPREPRTPEQVAGLITKLKEARQLDDRGIRDYTVDPVLAQDFAVQRQKTNAVINDLEIGEEVPRDQIHRALQVPENP
ncbi:MAG TPA: hypothetical protein VEC38_11710 [Candidatus Binataceae bacterium]|nr:hypothetical protein [Candidatus Binataceae bacterium]